jgi:hypothetical protein
MPTTCNYGQKTNFKYNDTNTPIYAKLRSTKVSDEEKKKIICDRIDNLKEMGVKARPWRYTV